MRESPAIEKLDVKMVNRNRIATHIAHGKAWQPRLSSGVADAQSSHAFVAFDVLTSHHCAIWPRVALDISELLPFLESR